MQVPRKGWPVSDKEASRPSLQQVLDDGVRAFYEAQGCSLVQTDLLFLDRARPADQILSVLQGLIGFAKEGGATAFRQVLIVVPAAAFEGEVFDVLVERVERFASLARERMPVRALPADWVAVRTCPVYHDNALLEIVQSVPNESAVIISHLADYRRAGIAIHNPGSNRMGIEEDAWAPHVIAIAKSLETIAEERTVYVAALVGRLPPHRPELTEAVHSIHGGVLGSAREDDLDSQLLALGDEIAAYIAAGRIGAALAVIDSLPPIFDDQKPFLKVQLLQRANLPQMALDQIERELVPGMDSFDGASLLKMAIIAEQAGGLALAARLLRAAIPKLTQRELLDAALELADRLDEFGVADAVMARVTTLFPDAPILKRREAHMAVAVGDFPRAAVLLQAIAGAEESAAFYGALGELVPGGSFDHDIVLAELVRRNPTWRKGGHRALVREAARRGQLYHAFRWALDAHSSVFSPDLLLEVMERMVLERTPAGDIPIAKEDSESAVRRLVRYLADNPTAG